MSAPYPWQVAPDCGDTDAQAIYDARGGKLALVFVRPVPPGSGSDAASIRASNMAYALEQARLMAAAPDLAEALELAEATLQRLAPDGSRATQGTRDVIAAALAKVRP